MKFSHRQTLGRKPGDEWETSDAVENDDGGLSAPLMYASVALGMITVWKRDGTNVAESGTIGGQEDEDTDCAETKEKTMSMWDERVSEWAWSASERGTPQARGIFVVVSPLLILFFKEPGYLLGYDACSSVFLPGYFILRQF